MDAVHIHVYVELSLDGIALTNANWPSICWIRRDSLTTRIGFLLASHTTWLHRIPHIICIWHILRNIFPKVTFFMVWQAAFYDFIVFGVVADAFFFVTCRGWRRPCFTISPHLTDFIKNEIFHLLLEIPEMHSSSWFNNLSPITDYSCQNVMNERVLSTMISTTSSF